MSGIVTRKDLLRERSIPAGKNKNVVQGQAM
jgi:hypothetical protein